ncbi:MAG: glycosyltransferase family 4 protein [Fidelibacterota bacterium]|nr:MAG: glycosyltransferase family 4 protein [Candidatus Neomarinimicrobiota bacterium]
MRLGILTRDEPVFSLQVYRQNLTREFAALGIEIISIPVDDPRFIESDVVWDPGLISARFPHPKLRQCHKPVVVTVHGLAAHTLSVREYFPDPVEAIIGQTFHQQVAAEWQWFSEKVSRVIAVSRYGADEVSSIFGLPQEKVVAIYHGIDHDVFNVQGEKKTAERPYILQIAQFAPKKNLDRVLDAYAQLPESGRPDLVVVLPNYEGADPEIKGVRIIREGLTQEELACWYRGALGFIFPSIHETFGMPVLEAMACGCPVISADVTAIPELAGDATILINPRSVEEITSGIQRLVKDRALQRRLREKGLERAHLFTWEKTAREHLDVFESVQ